MRTEVFLDSSPLSSSLTHRVSVILTEMGKDVPEVSKRMMNKLKVRVVYFRTTAGVASCKDPCSYSLRDMLEFTSYRFIGLSDIATGSVNFQAVARSDECTFLYPQWSPLSLSDIRYARCFGPQRHEGALSSLFPCPLEARNSSGLDLLSGEPRHGWNQRLLSNCSACGYLLLMTVSFQGLKQ